MPYRETLLTTFLPKFDNFFAFDGTISTIDFARISHCENGKYVETKNFRKHGFDASQTLNDVKRNARCDFI